jgi:hypothetical protein
MVLLNSETLLVLSSIHTPSSKTELPVLKAQTKMEVVRAQIDENIST